MFFLGLFLGATLGFLLSAWLCKSRDLEQIEPLDVEPDEGTKIDLHKFYDKLGILK